MDNLPQELVDRISEHLERSDLKNTLLVSTKFQRAAEKYSEAFSTYRLTKDNVDEFTEFCSGRHVRHLRNIEFRTSVPAMRVVDKDAFAENPCRDTADELQEMDEEFTRQVNLLFSKLHEVEQAGTLDGHGGFELRIYTPTRAMAGYQFCIHRMLTSWRIHLISPETLPSLAFIRSLLIENGTDFSYHDVPDPPFRKLDLRVLLDISAKLPNLEVLKCNLGGDEWIRAIDVAEARYATQDWPGPRRDSRHDFAKAIQAIEHFGLSHAQLDFIYPIVKADWIDQRIPMPDLVKPAIYDPFSSSLRLLSYQLRTMKLRVVADETLFWPADGSTPSWPKLESLSVMFHMASPSGTWYFEGPCDVGTMEVEDGLEMFEVSKTSYPPLETTDADAYSDWTSYPEDFNWDAHQVRAQYRVEPNNKTLVPFLTAFAKAAASMPSLKEAALWSPLMFCPDDIREYDGFDCKEVSNFTEGELAWGISYAKPGMKAFRGVMGEDYSASRQMWWYVGKWRPDPELLDLFQQIGRQEHGDQLSMYWGDRWTDPGLVERGDFEGWESWQFDR